MSTENSCRCVTEQNTRVVVRDDVCRDVARWGEPYNPHKAPAVQQGQAARGEQPEPQQHSRQPASVDVATVGQVPYTPGTRADQFPRSPGYPVNSYSAVPTTTL